MKGLPDLLAIFISSFAVTFLTIPLLKKIAFKLNILDKPTSNLKIHEKPVPYLGGIAILAGILISMLIANYQFSINQTLFWCLVLAATAVTFLGLIDDVIDIRQTYKFTAETILAVGLLVAGFRVEIFPTHYIMIPLTIFYVVGACNALNLLDGLDGLASGITFISSFIFFILFFENKDIFGITLSLALLGVCSAFLIYNFNPASIFMGDAGSMLLGLLLSILMIRYSSTPFDFKSFSIPILVCGVPIFDTALTYTRRYINDKPIFPGDRSHFYDQLVDRGFSVKKTVFISYVMGLFFGMTALVMKKVSDPIAIVIVISTLFVLTSIVVKMDLIRMRK